MTEKIDRAPPEGPLRKPTELLPWQREFAALAQAAEAGEVSWKPNRRGKIRGVTPSGASDLSANDGQRHR